MSAGTQTGGARRSGPPDGEPSRRAARRSARPGSCLFDSYLIVDWSSAAVPKRGRDSIWWALWRQGSGLVARGNPTTRAEAGEILAHLLDCEADLGRRVLAGFDFPFGYPAGFAARVTGHAAAFALWDWLEDNVADGSDNANDRFEVAARINGLFDGVGPFWGRPRNRDLPVLPERGSTRRGRDHPAERRLVERQVPAAQPVWKLFTTGSVGGQVLVGLPAVNRLRRALPAARVWPFEGGLADPGTAIVLAEIYPSLVPVTPALGEVKDAAQVRQTAAAFAALDAAGGLGDLFGGAAGLSDAERMVVETEEAWILGAGFEERLRACA